MSEIEIGTEIMMGVAALGLLVWLLWYTRRLEREAAAARKSERVVNGRDTTDSGA